MSKGKLGYYDPKKPQENRITDIGPNRFEQMLPPIIRKNYGKWLSHRILEPGLLMHVSETAENIMQARINSPPAAQDSALQTSCIHRVGYTATHLQPMPLVR